MRLLLKSQPSNQRGASLVEYVFLVALIATVCVVTLQNVGSKTNDNFNNQALIDAIN